MTSALTKVLSSRWFFLLPLLASAVPPLLIISSVAREGVNVPFWDEWEVLPLLERANEGSVTVADLWAPRNEHRTPLTRLVLLGLAYATGWDVRYELGANLVAALGTLGVLGLLIARTIRPVAPLLAFWTFLVASLMAFSPVQWENWLWGWEIAFFMNALAACLTVWVLARYGPSYPGPPLAVLSAAAAALTVANGLILFTLIPLVLIIDPRRPGFRSSLLTVAMTTAIGGAIVVLYLTEVTRPAYVPHLRLALSEPSARFRRVTPNAPFPPMRWLRHPYRRGRLRRLASAASPTGPVSIPDTNGPVMSWSPGGR